jgi:hypothetical protein
MSKCFTIAQEFGQAAPDLTPLTQTTPPPVEAAEVKSVKGVKSVTLDILPSLPVSPHQGAKEVTRVKWEDRKPRISSDRSPYGEAFGGLWRIWCGRLVIPAQCAELSDWDKHGSTGMLWNDLTRCWEPLPASSDKPAQS